MRKQRGFALVVFLTLLPVVAIIAWTYLQVGTTLRVKATKEERQVRALHAAEAGIRSYLATGQASSFELNDCSVVVTAIDAQLCSSATPKRGLTSVTVSLQIDHGFVVQRRTNEER